MNIMDAFSTRSDWTRFCDWGEQQLHHVARQLLPIVKCLYCRFFESKRRTEQIYSVKHGSLEVRTGERLFASLQVEMLCFPASKSELISPIFWVKHWQVRKLLLLSLSECLNFCPVVWSSVMCLLYRHLHNMSCSAVTHNCYYRLRLLHIPKIMQAEL